ncbi:MAG: VCBS repeat-containing protein, partial [Candidatus Gracilibacteria bacterium]
DGVPIWEWLPAIMCRLDEMMPPTISFSDDACGASLLSNDEERGGLNDGSEYLGNSEDNNGGSGENQGDTVICDGYIDTNGINDCIEQQLGDGGILELTSDSEKYYYNTNGELKATIKDKDGNTFTSANGTYIHFELQKIEEARDATQALDIGNIKVAYNIDDANNRDQSIISDYINFEDSKIISNKGISTDLIGSKGREVNLSLKAYIKINDNTDEESIFLESDTLKIEVRGDRLFNSTHKIKKLEGQYVVHNSINFLKVSDKDNIVLVDGTNKSINDVSNTIAYSSLSDEIIAIFIENRSETGEKKPISYPLDVTLFKGETEIKNFSVSEDDLSIYKSLFSIEKSGSYTIEIVDNEGYRTTKNIELIPEVPNYVDIQLGSTVMQTGGNVSTNFLAIYDEYLNITTGEFYDIDIEIDGRGVEFLDNNSDTLSTSTFEGYKIFRLKSTDTEGINDINVKISNRNGDEFVDISKSIEILDTINLVVGVQLEKIVVGGGTYEYMVSLKREDGTIITNFNSRAYLIANPIFLQAVNPFVKLENGVAVVEFTTKATAGENIPIEIQVEGLKNIIKRELTIYPDFPMKIDLVLSKNEIEASETSYSLLSVELKDRYNNLVFNDNSTNTTLEILEQYDHIITSDYDSSVVEGGKTTYKIYGTLNPGIAHFKISTDDPSLDSNSFVVEDEKGSVTINGVGENVGKIETFYFWNKSKIEGKKYNSIYTTLLGSNYGDINQQDYLAGSLLFEKDNRALAVTSLLTNPYRYSNILKLDKSGSLETIHSKQDLSQDIEINTKFRNDKLALDIYNKSLNIYLGEIFYNFDDNTKLIACELINEECIDEDETSISLKSFSEDYDVYIDSDKLVLSNIDGRVLLEIEKDGTINRLGTMNFVLDNSNNTDNLLINVQTGGITVAQIGFNFVDAITNISRDVDIFKLKIDQLKNSILVLIKTNSYGTYDYGSNENKSKIFYYNDPFASDNALNSFTKNNIYGYENFVKEGGLGWKASNKSLLAFAAGKSVGESVQDYMSFAVINLGDPVISLKKIKEKIPSTSIDRKFDATIGQLLSNDSDISGYHIFDYDNDSIDDILLVKRDNYFTLLENKKSDGRLLDKGNLAYITDLGNLELVGAGDFTGDGYDDIFFVNKEGEPYLLNNVNKDFSRYSLVKQFDLDGRILIAKVFDMDNDGSDDIVILDDTGEINIFYGGDISSLMPNFSKLTISEDNGVELNTSTRNDNSLIYFDGLYQPSEEPSDSDRIDNQLFIEYPYFEIDPGITYEGLISGEQQIEEERPSIYFLKTQYSESTGLKVEKSFKDKNGGFISSSDIVEAEIVLTNVSNNILSDVIFVERVPTTFSLDDESIGSDKQFDIKGGIAGYQFLIDGFDLEVNESITIRYEAKVKSITYSYIDVGLFENGEIGDDKYGDILLKEDNKNCGDTIDMFRSLEQISSRSYEKGIIVPTCDADKIELPDELTQNSLDVDGNGVPDYI